MGNSLTSSVLGWNSLTEFVVMRVKMAAKVMKSTSLSMVVGGWERGSRRC